MSPTIDPTTGQLRAPEVRNALSAEMKQALHAQEQAAPQVIQAALQIGTVRGQQFGGSRGRWCAHIGDEVADRYIGFVAYGADHRGDTGRHGARDRLFVEAPEVFQ